MLAQPGLEHFALGAAQSGEVEDRQPRAFEPRHRGFARDSRARAGRAGSRAGARGDREDPRPDRRNVERNHVHLVPSTKQKNPTVGRATGADPPLN